MITAQVLNPSKYATFYGDENPYVTLEGGEWVEKRHVYVIPGGGYLPGITGMIHRQLFPEKYKDIPQSILNNAAERGTLVHALCAKADEAVLKGEPLICLPPDYEMGITEAFHYTQMREAAGFYPIANEYTVSTPYMASSIDCVWGRGDEVILADIKTYYTKDEEYLSWQLSIYAYMFERQNPSLRVSELYGVWIYKDDPKKRQLIKVERKSDSEVEALMAAEINGTQYLPKKAQENALVAPMVIDTICRLKKQLQESKEIYDRCIEQLENAMREHNIKSWDAGVFKATISADTESTTFDSARFKKENPDLYNQYLKTTTRKGSLRLTLRNDE